MGIAPFPVNFGTQFLELFHTAAGQHHCCTCARQCFGKLRAQTAGSAGDKGHAAGKINAVRHLERLHKRYR